MPQAWRERVNSFIAADQPGRAMISFLIETIGLIPGQVGELKDTAGTRDILPVVTATMRREAEALASADPLAIAAAVTVPVLLIAGTASPPWAQAITEALHTALLGAEPATLPGYGHEAINTAPRLAAELIQHPPPGRLTESMAPPANLARHCSANRQRAPYRLARHCRMTHDPVQGPGRATPVHRATVRPDTTTPNWNSCQQPAKLLLDR